MVKKLTHHTSGCVTARERWPSLHQVQASGPGCRVAVEERIIIELMTSDRKLKPSREGVVERERCRECSGGPVTTTERRGNSSQFENNYFTEMCSGSEAGSYLRPIDLVYPSTLGLIVIKKRRGNNLQGLSCST